MTEAPAWIVAGWLAAGVLGAGGMNAQYRYNPPYWQQHCFSDSQVWRHRSEEMEFFLFSVGGPIFLIISFVETGGFPSGFSFDIGQPKRCDWAHSK